MEATTTGDGVRTLLTQNSELSLNIARLVYTCQKPKHKGCKFFLWADEAKIREEAAVLSNSRSEPNPPMLPRTPQKQTPTGAPPTPQTRSNAPRAEVGRTPVQAKAAGELEKEDNFAWSSSDDEALLKAEQEVLERTPYQTPKKAPRTETFTSPGKRALAERSPRVTGGDDTWPLSDDVFTTPSTSHKSNGTGLLSPNTSANRPTQMEPPEPEPSTLATQALQILRKSNSQLDSEAENDLVELLNTHDLRTQGIIKGREITRIAVQSKEQKIAELQSRISLLEAEKETNRRVISHLKTDMVESPKKGPRRSMPTPRRSEV